MLVRDPLLLLSMCVQLIRALQAMHVNAGCAHMDIKLENVLIANNGTLKLCDFGFATSVNHLVNRRMGTELYMAPEIHWASEVPCEP